MEHENLQFFTHDIKEEPPFRVVITGLEEMEIDDLRAELAVCNIQPTDIRILIPKRIRYERHANYILHFKRGCTTIKKLRETKSLFHTIINWAPFKHFNGRSTQCRRCQLPGHGTRNCNLPPRCKNCAGFHLTDDFSALPQRMDEHHDDDNPASLQIQWKCANCNGPHAADDINCPSLMDYNNLQRKLSSRNRAQQKERLQPNTNGFPPLGHGPGPFRRTIGQQGRSYSAVLQNQNTFIPRGVSSRQELEIGDSADLFSYEECINLVQDLVTGLGRCSSKSEQFQLISSCCLKYVYGSD